LKGYKDWVKLTVWGTWKDTDINSSSFHRLKKNPLNYL
jgi:hypothetical protein